MPVHVARDLTPEQVRGYRIADNKTAEAAEWDYDLLPIELSALQEAGFDLGLLGFDADELADLLDPGVQAGLTDPDDVPEAAAETITQPGDLWLLGHHRLLCGDATKAEDLDRLMDGTPADLLLTDPPYGVSYVGKTAEALTIANDAMEGEEYRRFLAAAFTAGAGHLRPGGSFYIWHADTAGLPDPLGLLRCRAHRPAVPRLDQEHHGPRPAGLPVAARAVPVRLGRRREPTPGSPTARRPPCSSSTSRPAVPTTRP